MRSHPLGPVQESLLAALERCPHGPTASDPCQLACTGDLVTLIGRPPTASNFVVVSRALKSLVQQGLVEAHYPPVPRAGNGGRYALREQSGSLDRAIK